MLNLAHNDTPTYALLRKSTSKFVRWAATRSIAREIKKAHGFKLAIVNSLTGRIVR